VASLVAINANEAMVAPIAGSALSTSLESGLMRSVLCRRVSRNLASINVRMFPYLRYTDLLRLLYFDAISDITLQ
jgi:hypothetical protein